MTLSADSLLERNHLKRLLTRWRILAITALVVALAVLAGKAANPDGTALPGSYIARISIEGIITDNTDRDALFKRIREDESAKAVIVRLDTPGGSAVGGQEVYIALREIAKKKPVVAVMRTMATSAGYMAALGGDYILAREGTVTGSIGVMVQSAEVTGLAEKLGIEPITVKSGPLKGAPSPFEKNSPEAIASVQSVVNDFFQVFVDMIVQRRQLPRETVLQIADGRIYTGRQALALKLVDAMGGEKEALDWLAKTHKIDAKLTVREVKEKKESGTWIEKLADFSPSGFIGSLNPIPLDGLVGIWQPSAM